MITIEKQIFERIYRAIAKYRSLENRVYSWKRKKSNETRGFCVVSLLNTVPLLGKSEQVFLRRQIAVI